MKGCTLCNMIVNIENPIHERVDTFYTLNRGDDYHKTFHPMTSKTMDTISCN